MEYITSGEAARLLRVSVTTLRNYEQKGILLPAMKYPSGRRAYNREDIEAFLDKIKVGGKSENVKD